MPTSKNDKLYYTKEQYQAAQENNNALEYALRSGYRLVRTGAYYHMPEHDSLVFDSKGNFWWNSVGVHGHAIEFMMHYEGKTFPEAVLELANAIPTAQLERKLSAPGAVKQIRNTSPRPKAEFHLPPHAANMRRLFAYLCRTRKLRREVVQLLIDQGLLYESAWPTEDGQVVQNACFVSYGPDGKPCSAFERGMVSSGQAFKREVPGGDKSHGWIIRGQQPQRIYVFEAAIDAASYVDYYWEEEPLRGADYLALGGVAFTPVDDYLSRHSDIREVILSLDNDPAGRSATIRFCNTIQEKYPHISVTICFPPAGKDWNDSIRWLRKTEGNTTNIIKTTKE